MLDESDYEDDPTQAAATTGERIEENASEALSSLDRGPLVGDIADAVDDAERAIEEIDRQQEAAKQAIENLTGARYGEGGVIALAEGADDAYDLLDEIRGMSRSMVEGLVAAEAGSDPAAETEVEIAGSRYRIRFDPMEEAETADDIDLRSSDPDK